MSKPTKLNCETCASRLLGVLCNLEQSALEECSTHKTTNTYKKGQVIFYEGNQAYALYCIFSGRVKIYKSGVDGKQQIVRIAGPGELLGYRSLFANEPYHATAEALEDATICAIDKTAFFSLLSKNPQLSLNIIKKLADDLRRAEELATSIATRSVRERMAELLLLLKEAYGRPGKRGILLDLDLSRTELSEMIGMAQETAIRLLSEFKQDGWIELDGHRIIILDEEGLREAARLEATSG